MQEGHPGPIRSRHKSGLVYPERQESHPLPREELMEERSPHQSALRRGRVSQAGRIYLVTTATVNRQPIFAQLATARQVTRALRNNDLLGHTSTLAFVVMPDHLHWLFQLGSIRSLSGTVSNVKRASARGIGRPIWQEGFHDHAVRRDEDLARLSSYVVNNPVRAGLVAEVGHYPHWDVAWLPG
jgi:REP element-mobilizing transposase RayT